MIIQFVNRQRKYPTGPWQDLIRYALPIALAACRAGVQLATQRLEAIVTVTFAGPRVMQRINRENRGIDRLTDVLSFPMMEAADGSLNQEIEPFDLVLDDPDCPAVLLGDLVISLDRAFEQASDYGHAPGREVAFLAVHGLLHLLGYDHVKPDDEQAMLAMQKNIMNQIGLKRGTKHE